MTYDPVIFREYDVRGVFNGQFDLDFAGKLGRSIVKYFSVKRGLNTPTIAIGHDARLSSPGIVKALADGIKKSGANVVHLGLVTTPIAYFATFALDEVDGSIMVTGSHNPPEYNGFKISIGKSTIFGSEIKALEKFIIENDFLSGEGKESRFDIFPKYIERYQNEFGKLRPVKVVLDCGNGAAGVIARRLFNSVGLEPEILFEEPDGRFPNHHPDPTVEENLTFLAEKVRSTGAVAGIGFDGDADRIGVVDENGQMVFGDELIALVSRFVLEDHPQATIVGDVKCSDRMYDYIRKYNGQPIMWKTGHSLIKEKIKVEKAPFGGELSGHVFFADRNYGYDDSLYAGLRLVEILSRTGKTIRQILADYPVAHSTPEIRIDTTEEKKLLIVDRLKKAYSKDTENYKVNFTDGVRISFKDGWALIRSSNTQPVIVLRFESDTEKGLERIRGEIESLVTPLL